MGEGLREGGSEIHGRENPDLTTRCIHSLGVKEIQRAKQAERLPATAGYTRQGPGASQGGETADLEEEGLGLEEFLLLGKDFLYLLGGGALSFLESSFEEEE